tara:strand:- start:1496 stop:2122 length:627 start_codon:yes stop_codon:yes gene_type:complete
MEDIVEQKGIEKIEVSEPKVEEIVEKKRKPRSEAQKAAFEKARLKRAENLAKKKLEEEQAVTIDETQNIEQEVPQTNLPKKRGRPKGSRKLKREPEPKLGQPNFLPQNIPPEAGDIRYQYQHPPTQSPYQFNPMMYQQQFQPPPQVHNYYYGHQQQNTGQPAPQPQTNLPEPEPQVFFEESSEEEEVDDDFQYPEDTYQEPVLKFRFA